MKKYFYILIAYLTALSLNAVKLEIENKEVYFNFGTGIAYNFNLSYEVLSPNDLAFFDIPLSFEFDFRPRRDISFTTGLDFSYNFHLYKLNGFTIENHNLWIDIPFNVKFYPVASREETHYYFYLGAGVFFRAWPLQFYTMKSDSTVYSGNGYAPDNTYIQPGDSFMPVNIGTTFFIGNIFKFSKTVGAGLEIAGKYLFIPYINGYISKSSFNSTNDKVYLNFWGSVGIKLYLHFDLTNKRL
ncbi:MAG TPA: hypothetical protein DDY71_01610 [Spirochaetia bacterium]|nr:MAG: hypothetical protein A2Y30_07720 [Spirochaetes bacterium GWE1_32_154]HBI36316.1 hypothetical protein [Spirochaetia bacterium]